MIEKSVNLFILEFLRDESRIQTQSQLIKTDFLKSEIKIGENIITLSFYTFGCYNWVTSRAEICPVDVFDDFVDVLDNFSYFDAPAYSLSLDKYQMKLLLNYSVRAESLTLDSMRDLTIGFSERIDAVKSLYEDKEPVEKRR